MHARRISLLTRVPFHPTLYLQESIMFFYAKRPASRSFSPSGVEKDERYRLEPMRLVLAVVIFTLLVVAAFVAKVINWPEAMTLFLHLSEVTFGGLIGLFFGEKTAISVSGRNEQ
jgi:hypothetical protein